MVNRFREINGVAVDWNKITQFKKMDFTKPYSNNPTKINYAIIYTMSKQDIEKIINETITLTNNKKLIIETFDSKEKRDVRYNFLFVRE